MTPPSFTREELDGSPPPPPPPPQFEPEDDLYDEEEEFVEEEYDDEDAEHEVGTVLYRGATSDPAFGYLIAIALSVGLLPLISSGAPDMRYTVCWLTLGVVGVLAWLLGNTERIGQETPENLAWGIIFGLIVSTPFLLFGGDVLREAVDRIFPAMGSGTILAFLVFVMPTSETLFFRGVMQQNRSFLFVSGLSSIWSMFLFLPMISIGEFPYVALVIAIVLVIVNTIYSHIRRRNGLAAAWICQIVMNLILVFLPSL